MISGFVNSFLIWIIKQRIRQIETFKQYPEETQQNVLAVNLSRAAKTEYGKEYAFHEIKSYPEFARRLPIVNYEDIEPQIERMRGGEENILWPSETRWFAKSSGTTNAKSKFIPVSDESLEDCHFKAGKDMLAMYFNNKPESRIFTGLSLRLGGSTEINNINNHSFFGDLSAILIENFPLWVEFRSTPPREISLMNEWESKIEKIAETTIQEDVTSLAGVPSWMLVLMHKVLEKTGKDSILDVWPNLELYMHGGVSFAPYRTHFEKIIPSKTFNYMEIYNASEGFFGIQDQLGSQEMLLMLDYGIFYEFIPIQKINDDPHSHIIPLAEVELGENYAMVITTNGGLWRYMLGDTVHFTSLRPYRFQISGRTKHFINVFGEELMVENADKALEKAARETNAEVVEYSAAPIFMNGNDSGAHEWIIAFRKKPEEEQAFTEALDRNLKALNSDYEAKRHKDMALKMPVIHFSNEDIFYQWLKSKNKLGGQHKVPRLSNKRDVLDELLTIHRAR